jgi:two-component system CheB/CheR fusion protein
VQHHVPGFPSYLAQILGARTKWNVIRAASGMQLVGGHIYVCPPDVLIGFSSGRFLFNETSQSTASRGASIDHLFFSLAQAYRKNTAAVVLSGTGNDGSLGVAEVSRAGGYVLVEEPSLAAFSEMPKNAIASKFVDTIAPVADLVGLILAHVSSSKNFGHVPAGAFDLNVRRLIALIRARHSWNPNGVSSAVLWRILERRARVLGRVSVEEYLNALQAGTAGLNGLVEEIVLHLGVGIDAPRSVPAEIAEILTAVSESHAEAALPVRVWVAGVGTGEWAYLLAIALQQIHSAHSWNLNFKVFATDLTSRSYRSAQAGVYPRHFSEELLDESYARFFTIHNDEAVANSCIRERISFAVHDYVNDPPFPNLSLIVFLHSLEALTQRAREKVFSSVLSALRKRGGYLFCPLESEIQWPAPFEQRGQSIWYVPRLDGISMRQLKAWHPSGHAPGFIATAGAADDALTEDAPTAKAQQDALVAKLALQRGFVPLIVINPAGKIEYIFGDMSYFASISIGRFASTVSECLGTQLSSVVKSLQKRLDTSNADSGVSEELFVAGPSGQNQMLLV